MQKEMKMLRLPVSYLVLEKKAGTLIEDRCLLQFLSYY